MRVSGWAVLTWLLCAPAARAEAALKRCPLLATSGAAALLGSRAAFLGASEKPEPGRKRSVVCFFGAGRGMSLTVKYGPATPSDPKGAKEMVELMRQVDAGVAEADVGERAYSVRGNSALALTVLVKGHLLQLELQGQGLGPRELEKLRQAARTAAARL